MREKLPVSYLLFTRRGRINRMTFWSGQVFIWLAFYILFNIIDLFIGFGFTLLVYPLLFWALYCTAAKRLHDRNRSSWLLLFTLIPIIGPLWLFIQLGFRKGNPERNKHGLPQGHKDDYFENPEAQKIPHIDTEQRIVDDVTQLNPIIVDAVCRPKTIEELQEVVNKSTGTISIGGGRFSMGGHTASKGSLHIDMRGLNAIEDFDPKEKTITVQAGIRWCDIQRHVDSHDLSVKIMQSYANFTVGGSLSVNAHGRYMGLGPVILSVKSIDVLLADGSIKMATPNSNEELFYGTIGCYNALGIILRATLELAENTKLKRVSKTLKTSEFLNYFESEIKNDPNAIMHNTDIYPPSYKNVRAATWVKTTDKPTTRTRLIPLKGAYPLERYFLWAFTETPFGKWRREKIIDPLLYVSKKVHWRNYEAGFDVSELEPKSRKHTTYVLREYFVPVRHFDAFANDMHEIYSRHRVNVLNVSIRHAEKDTGSYLSWANEEMFAFVVYYKQRTRENAKSRVAVWTREMNEATIKYGGTFYLPYQIHATSEQFHAAYPKAKDLFKLKEKYDPNFRFSNKLWDTYYKPNSIEPMAATDSEFKTIMDTTTGSDKMYRFLQVIFHLFPEDRFHQLIVDACKVHTSDEKIYKDVQSKLASIKPFLSEFTYSLPALKTQKKEMTKQTMQILGDVKAIDGYLEIGSTGRYISDLRKTITVSGGIHIQNDIAPGYGIGDFFERGRIAKFGTFIDLAYDPITEAQIPTNSLDVVTCFIGLHHCPIEKLDAYVASIQRILKPGGKFIMRDHDCDTSEMVTFASLVHTVFNLGLKETWEFNQDEFRNFKSIEAWCTYLEGKGFTDTKHRILQENDPSLNTLTCFINNK